MFTRLPQWLSDKKSLYTAGDVGSIPGLGRSPGEGNGNLFRYSCKENSMGRRACWVTVHGVSGWGHIKVHQYNLKKRKPQRQKEPYNQGTCEYVVFWCYFGQAINHTLGFSGGSGAKNPPANARDVGSIPESGRSPGEGNDNPLQYSCLENLRRLVGYSLSGHKRIGHNLVTKQHSDIKTTHYF